MKITAIKEQVKNPERVSIFIDGKYSFSLTLSQLLDERLKNGTELDDARIKALKKTSDEGKLKMRALDWLTLRPHSRRELQDYLRRKKVEPDFADALVKEFSDKGYVDDLYFAGWLAGQRRHKLRSTRAIRAELAKKGVPSEIIAETLGDENSGEKDRLKELVIKKRMQPRYHDNEKIMAYLLRQGYSYGDIKQVLAELDEQQ